MSLRQIIFLFAGLVACNYSGFTQEISNKPSAIISAVFWDRFTTKSLTYAPWGNIDDRNATKITLQVGFSTPSQPFAYYGKSPIRFFETIFLEEQNQDGSYEQRSEEFAEFSFEHDLGETKELFLIFLKQRNQSSFRVFSLPLAQERLEYGSFVCYSQHKEPLYLAYGNQKQVLGAGKSVKFKRDDKGDESVQLKVFKRSGAKYEEAASDYLALSSKRRSIGFLAPNHNRVRLKRYYFNKTPIESSIGYDSAPFTEIVENNSEDNSTGLLGSP